MSKELKPNLQPIIFAAVTAVLGILVAVAPQTFASVCKVTGKPMKCFWTARAEIFLGISIAVFAALQILFALKNLNTQANIALNLAIAVNAIGVILVPSALIGVCAKPMMHCHSVTKPFLIVAAILIILIAALQTALALVQRSNKTGE
ncbi:DUF4418 family protein [Treponema sp.]|uniref:DUF4418 family protein n=1 Tax=Treponema sp. TaxID=166 RepID=UPI003F08ED44